MLAEFIATAATGASLAMDAFSVSICIGLCHDRISAKNVLTVGGAFGFFQFFMPLLGGVIAGGLSGFFSTWTPWIAAALIVWVAVNMIREAASGGEDDCSSMTITLRSMTVLSFATSLDALAVGFSIESTGGSAMSLAVLAGIITFALSAFRQEGRIRRRRRPADYSCADNFAGAVKNHIYKYNKNSADSDRRPTIRKFRIIQICGFFMINLISERRP